ncbi:DMT family transporter [Peribacillus sp. NPDC097675]|uniref:DMT family transporter n=1 Tax=Peribacillus sp. NPDC097675 TaxID=3390618 RepID=UPI003CFD6151
MNTLSRPVTAISIAFVVMIWGLCWPIYKVALIYSPPLLYAGMRTLLGGLLLAFTLLPQWKKIQWKRNWYIYVIVAFFNTIIFNGVQTIGLQYLPSGLFSVIVYLQPVLVVLIAWMWLKETLSAIKIVGLMIGFLGVVLVCLDGMNGNISYIGILLALITAIGWAFGVVYVKKTSTQVHGLWLVAMQSIMGGSFLTGSGLAVENVSNIVWNRPYIFCLIFGSIFSMALATAVYFKLMSSGEASKVGSFTFLVPLIAVGIGTLFLGEPFTASLLEGMVLILLSIYLINRQSSTKAKKNVA